MPDFTRSSKASIKNRPEKSSGLRNGIPNQQDSRCGKPTRDGACLFERAAAWTVRVTGGRWGFLGALMVVIVWAISGPYFHYSEMWQLIINTGTTIVTFLMVFLIQNAQNRESKALHLKLDELIFAVRTANNELIDIENLTEAQLEKLALRYRSVAEKHHRRIERRDEELKAAIDRVAEKGREG